jgi:hypothetical protein
MILILILISDAAVQLLVIMSHSLRKRSSCPGGMDQVIASNHYACFVLNAINHLGVEPKPDVSQS